MRILTIILFLVLSAISCRQRKTTDDTGKVIPGKWLVVYPDHRLNTEAQRKLYATIQDSIIMNAGLKLVWFDRDGSFRQADSLQHSGRWEISPEDELFISGGGAGFENFRAEVSSYKKGVLQLTEYMPVEQEQLKLVWNLKRIDDKDEGATLFEEESYNWKKPPAQPETPEQLRARLSAALHHYAGYYKLISTESSYFIPSRIILPLAFYQHAIGLKPFKPESRFATLFYNEEQARQAHLYIEQTLYRLRGKFPSIEKSYVKEYAAFMKMMAEDIRK